MLPSQRACSMSLSIHCAKLSSITFSIGRTNEWLVAWLTGTFRARLVHQIEITTRMVIFITGNKICCNEIIGRFFSNTHARFLGLEAFSLTNAKLGCPVFALSSTIYFPMYPIPPIIKILLFRAFEREFRMKWINAFKQTRVLSGLMDYLWVILSFKQTRVP